MKRLIDEEGLPGTPEARLTELVRQASRFQPAPFRRQRVLANLRRAQPRARRLFFRTSMATVLAVATAAVAAAAIERHWIPTEPVESPVMTAGTQALQAVAPRSGGSRSTPDLADEMPTTPPATAAADPPKRAASGTRPASRPSGGADVRAADLRAAARPRAHGDEDPARVLEAIRTLRNGGDATYAAALLDGYLRAHPTGVLVEDALALSIEAADARRDRRAAADYGDRYLRQFPAGRFRTIAAQAVQRRDP